MRHNKLALYIHLVWATWDRQPSITQKIERRLYRNIESQAATLDCTVLALNGMPDRVHLLVSVPTTITIAQLVQQIKGVSSHFVNEVIKPSTGSLWQGSYGAFTVSRWDVDRIIEYIHRQKAHHADQTVWPEWEETFEELQRAGSKHH